jgi:hypothetical protein
MRNHLKKVWIDIWLSLKIKDAITQGRGNLIKALLEEVRFEVSSVPSE